MSHTHMRTFAYLAIALALPFPLHAQNGFFFQGPREERAQNDIPLLLPEEKRAVEVQNNAFSRAISPILQTAAKSTVRVWAGSRRLAYGTVVGDGSRILSKWSEVAGASGNLRVDDGNQGRNVTVIGVYEDEDLALLEVQGRPLTPVEWSFATPRVGSFLAAPQPDGRLAAFGVVSVLERNLRDNTDLAYLGVMVVRGYTGVGVKIDEVVKDSGAAAAGLVPEDVILKVAERSISGLLELKNALIGLLPGQTINLLVDSGGKEKNVAVLLGNLPDKQERFGQRLQEMERMGGPISRVRTSFTRAIQTDMKPKPNQIGGPVVDLQGRAVGITVARADRTRSFVMPAAAVVSMLEKEAVAPTLAQVRTDDAQPQVASRANAPRNGEARPRAVPEERMRRHLTDMERLTYQLYDELDSLERQP